MMKSKLKKLGILGMMLTLVAGSIPADQVADYFTIGKKAQEDGDYELAISCWSSVLKLQPTNDAAFFNRGMAYTQKGDFTSGIHDFDETIRLNPEARAYDNRGNLYDQKGRWTKPSVITVKPSS